jgi:hypothetical protein
MNIWSIALHFHRDEILQGLFPHAEFLPGAEEIVHHAKEKWGVPIAIATSSNKEYLTWKSQHKKHFFDQFDTIICGDHADVCAPFLWHIWTLTSSHPHLWTLTCGH